MADCTRVHKTILIIILLGVVFAVYNQFYHCCSIDTVIVNEMQHVLMIVIMFLTNLSLLAQFCENLTRLHRIPPLIVTTGIVPGWQQHIAEENRLF